MSSPVFSQTRYAERMRAIEAELVKQKEREVKKIAALQAKGDAASRTQARKMQLNLDRWLYPSWEGTGKAAYAGATRLLKEKEEEGLTPSQVMQLDDPRVKLAVDIVNKKMRKDIAMEVKANFPKYNEEAARKRYKANLERAIEAITKAQRRIKQRGRFRGAQVMLDTFLREKLALKKEQDAVKANKPVVDDDFSAYDFKGDGDTFEGSEYQGDGDTYDGPDLDLSDIEGSDSDSESDVFMTESDDMGKYDQDSLAYSDSDDDGDTSMQEVVYPVEDRDLRPDPADKKTGKYTDDNKVACPTKAHTITQSVRVIGYVRGSGEVFSYCRSKPTDRGASWKKKLTKEQQHAMLGQAEMHPKMKKDTSRATNSNQQQQHRNRNQNHTRTGN